MNTHITDADDWQLDDEQFDEQFDERLNDWQYFDNDSDRESIELDTYYHLENGSTLRHKPKKNVSIKMKVLDYKKEKVYISFVTGLIFVTIMVLLFKLLV